MRAVGPLLREEPDRIPGVVEEVLRLAPPIQQLGRRATCPVELGGRTVPLDAKVALNVFSANRDDSRFERADEFDPARERNPHLTFGHGPHVCLGAPVAREELRRFAGQLLAKTSSVALDGEPQSNGRPLRVGWTSVPIRCDR